MAFRCDSIPEYDVRLKLDKLVGKNFPERLIVFADKVKGRQIWQWMRREPGKPLAIRAYPWSTGQSGELLLQKFEHLVVTLEQEDEIGMGDILRGVRSGFDVEKVTRKFYERFKAEHQNFLKFVKGIPDEQMETWYASVMINRLMFLYFIQAKGFLNGDREYLRNKLKESRSRAKDVYYRDFLCPLFFQGFARKKEDRSAAMNKLLGDIPYLNGGLFQKHEIETKHGTKIEIADKAFDQIFTFFAEYDWHLDDREARDGNEINPDVLGYIFEKYINQKELGAYYTKEDITSYIARNTIIPFLLDATRKDCSVAFDRSASVWRLLRDDPDRYIYDAVRHGAELPLPPDITAGICNIGKRIGWNRSAPPEYALPTETWRETVARRGRCEALRAKLAGGNIQEVNELVTLNLDICQFAQDIIQYAEGPELVRALYKAITRMSILDPTCGSGAFLFAALNILKPLYEACLQRMQLFVAELDAGGVHHPKKFEDLRQILADSQQHPRQDYFILKSIIVNNLYGVDIVEEAIEICKLRLFLKLVAHVESAQKIEPLPDIDFNIKAGNTLVGYVRVADISKGQANVFLEDQIALIEDRAKSLDSALAQFRLQQTKLHGTVSVEDKAELKRRFAELDGELNDLLSAEYGVKKSGLKAWCQSHAPLHWFSEFHQIMNAGGFSVIIGNPPYLEYREVKSKWTLLPSSVATLACGNLYAYCYERCLALQSPSGRVGLIIPVASVSTDGYASLRRALTSTGSLVVSSFNDRPSKLFDGLEHIRLSILLHNRSLPTSLVSGKYCRWSHDWGFRGMSISIPK